MDDRRAQRLRAAFTVQAATIEDPTLGAAFTSGLSWLVELAERVATTSWSTCAAARAWSLGRWRRWSVQSSWST